MNTFLGPRIKLMECRSHLVRLCVCHIAIVVNCGKLKMYNVVVASYSTTFIPSFVKIDQVVQGLKTGTHTRTHTYIHTYIHTRPSILKSALLSFLKE